MTGFLPRKRKPPGGARRFWSSVALSLPTRLPLRPPSGARTQNRQKNQERESMGGNVARDLWTASSPTRTTSDGIEESVVANAVGRSPRWRARSPACRRSRYRWSSALPHAVSLISTLAAGFGLALLLGFVAARLRPAGAGRLPARRHRDRPGDAGLRRRRRDRRPAGRDRRDAADVRRRPALLARRPAGGAQDRAARRGRADGGGHARWAPALALLVGLDAAARRWCSASRCRWRARWCC